MQPIQMPSFWEPLLKGYVKKTFYADTRKKSFADRAGFTEGDYRFFSTGVRDLNIAFTQERHALPHNYLNKKELRSGYILYFLPVNALKVAALLQQNPIEGFNQPQRGVEGEAPTALPVEGATRAPITIIDVGSGPGTGMLGLFYYLEKLLRGRTNGKLELKWILIDQNRQALNDAAALHEGALGNIRKVHPTWQIVSELRLVAADLFSERLNRVLEPQGADLVLALNVLSELPRGKRLPIVESLLKGYLADRGRLLVMEPALRLTSRDLMELRDEILQRGTGVVYAPCLHQADCPMLRANDRDWCHAYIPWERPGWIEKIDRLVAIRKDYLKCSHLLLGKEPPPTVPKDIWRVVSGPLNSKGKTERLLCGESSLPCLLRATRLDRDRSQNNSDFDLLERGDLVFLPNRFRIDKGIPCRKLNKF